MMLVELRAVCVGTSVTLAYELAYCICKAMPPTEANSMSIKKPAMTKTTSAMIVDKDET